MKNIVKNEASIVKLLLLLLLNINYIHAEELPLNVRDICDVSSERFPDRSHNVSDILLSYEECLKTLDRYSGPTKEFLLKQLGDKLECFKEDLKQMYYAGNVRYSEVEKVESLETAMQKGDKLNVENLRVKKRKCDFSRPARCTVKHIIPLVLTGTLEEKKRACDALFKLQNGNFSQIDILTPKLDNNKDPTEMTVPLKQPATYKIDSPEAENILPQYYKVIMKCLTLTTGHKIQVFKFNKKFYDWLTQAVLPHLKDDKCYPAFGGVLRIVETMRQKDFVPKNATANFIFYRQRDLDKNIQESKMKIATGRIFSFPYFPLIVLTWLLFILILCCFLLWRSGRCLCIGCGRDDDSCSSGSTEVFYYPIEETPSISLDLDEICSSHTSLKTDPSQRNSDPGNNKVNPGDTQVYTMTYEQSHTLTGIPLKRQFSSENSFQSSRNTKSDKRYKKMWSGFYK